MQQQLIELFLQNIPEELVLVFTASVFLKVKIDKFKIIILGIISGIIVHTLRSLPLSFGFHSIIFIFLLTIIFSRIYNKKTLQSLFAVIKTLFLISIFEAVTINIYLFISKTALEEIQNPLFISLLMVPQIILTFLVGLIILYYRQQREQKND